MAKPPRFSLACVSTVCPVAFLYLGMVVVSMFTETSGKMEIMSVWSMAIPGAALTIIIGALVFLPGIVAGPDRLQSTGLWGAHLLLCTCISFVIMIICTLLVIGLGG